MALNQTLSFKDETDVGGGVADVSTSSGIYKGGAISAPSKHDTPMRNCCSINHVTLNELNMHFTVSDYVSADHNYNYNSYNLRYYPLYCTPYKPANYDWTMDAKLPSFFRTNGMQTAERDYWADPRFNANACYECSVDMLTYLYKDCYGSVHIATLDATAGTVTDMADIGPVKRILVLLVAGGGGGGAGLFVDGFGKSSQGSGNNAVLATAGGGGGGGASRFVVVDVDTLKKTDIVNVDNVKKNSVCISVGAGGYGGEAYKDYNHLSWDYAYARTLQATGKHGGTTSISRYDDGNLVMYAGCYGGAGGGEVRKYSWGYMSKEYCVTSIGGSGGASFDDSGKGTYYWDVYFRRFNADSSSYPTVAKLAGYFGGNGESVDTINNIIARGGEQDGVSPTQSGRAYLCGENACTLGDSYHVSLTSGGKKTVRSSVYCSDDQQARFEALTLVGGGGGASAFGDGSEVSIYKYDGASDVLTANMTQSGVGAGGCGGYSIYSPTSEPPEAFRGVAWGQDGGDGCALIWYPQTPQEYTKFLHKPHMYGEYFQGEWSVTLYNGNSFDTVAKVIITDRYGGDEASYQEIELASKNTTTIMKGAERNHPLEDDDVVTVFFTSGVNVSEEVSYTLDSGDKDTWSV